MMDGILKHAIGVTEANEACAEASREETLIALNEAVVGLERINEGKAMASLSPFENWYRGDKKMNYPEIAERTDAVLGEFQLEANSGLCGLE